MLSDKSAKCIPFYTLNCRSVKNKTTSINDFILSNNVDIICLTENWLRPDSDQSVLSELTPYGYSVFQKPRHISEEVASPSYTEIRLMLNTKNLANVSHILNISNVVSMLEINIFAFVSFIVHHLQRPIVSETQYF